MAIDDIFSDFAKTFDLVPIQDYYKKWSHIVIMKSNGLLKWFEDFKKSQEKSIGWKSQHDHNYCEKS